MEIVVPNMDFGKDSSSLPPPHLLRLNRSGVVAECCSYFWIVGARQHTAPRDVRLVTGLARELGDWRCFFGDV
jgi:hypothetical protein